MTAKFIVQFTLRLLFFSGLLLGASGAMAELWDTSDSQLSSVQLHGFSTVGAAWLNQKNAVLVRDFSSRMGMGHYGNPADADSRLGLQADWQTTSRLSMTVQAVAAPRIEQNANNMIPWAFLKYDFDDNISVRAGRMGVYCFALSDQRNLGYVYPWVRPPVEFYAFMPIYSMTGADVSWHHDFSPDRSIEVRTFAARSDSSYYLPDPVVNTDSFSLNLSPMLGGTVIFNDHNASARLAYMTMKIGSTFPGLENILQQANTLGPYYPPLAGLGQNADIMGTSVAFYDASFSYDNGKLLVLSEMAATAFQSQFKPSMLNGYLTLGWHLTPDLLPFVNYSRVSPLRSTYQVATAAAPTGTANLPVAVQLKIIGGYYYGQSMASQFNTRYFNGFQENQETFSMGLRWDFRPRMDLKLQVDKTLIIGNGYELWQYPPTTSLDPRGVTGVTLTWDTVF